MTTSLADLRLRAQQRSDQVNSNFVSPAEWVNYINASYFELYDLLVQKYGDNYYVALDGNNKPYQFTTDGVKDTYGLPDGTTTYLMPDGSTAPAFYKALGVSLLINAGTPSQYITLKPFMFGERDTLTRPGVAIRGRAGLRYRINGNGLWLRPFPMSGQTLVIHYVPRMTPLVDDEDTVDGISGWEEYVVVDAAIKAMQKEESDVSVLMAQKQALIARIESAADSRDAGMPARVVDVRRDNNYGMGGLGWNGEDW